MTSTLGSPVVGTTEASAQIRIQASERAAKLEAGLLAARAWSVDQDRIFFGQRVVTDTRGNVGIAVDIQMGEVTDDVASGSDTFMPLSDLSLICVQDIPGAAVPAFRRAGLRRHVPLARRHLPTIIDGHIVFVPEGDGCEVLPVRGAKASCDDKRFEFAARSLDATMTDFAVRRGHLKGCLEALYKVYGERGLRHEEGLYLGDPVAETWFQVLERADELPMSVLVEADQPAGFYEGLVMSPEKPGTIRGEVLDALRRDAMNGCPVLSPISGIYRGLARTGEGHYAVVRSAAGAEVSLPVRVEFVSSVQPGQLVKIGDLLGRDLHSVRLSAAEADKLSFREIRQLFGVYAPRYAAAWLQRQGMRVDGSCLLPTWAMDGSIESVESVQVGVSALMDRGSTADDGLYWMQPRPARAWDQHNFLCGGYRIQFGFPAVWTGALA